MPNGVTYQPFYIFRIQSLGFTRYSDISFRRFFPLQWKNVGVLGSVPGKFLDIIVGQDPSDSESNRLHVDIFWFCFHYVEVYFSIDSS
jgi:hypothetical protein